ncbi:hypothetical protein F4810DRAFT_462060 [Camillea tinctor]|nr:hypothetical protein F4810DRAFT_462060 [Camillea tinctor]
MGFHFKLDCFIARQTMIDTRLLRSSFSLFLLSSIRLIRFHPGLGSMHGFTISGFPFPLSRHYLCLFSFLPFYSPLFFFFFFFPFPFTVLTSLFLPSFRPYYTVKNA